MIVIGPAVTIQNFQGPPTFANSYYNSQFKDVLAGPASEPSYVATDVSVTTEDPGLVMAAVHRRVGCRLIDVGQPAHTCLTDIDDTPGQPPTEVECPASFDYSCSGTHEADYSEIIKLDSRGKRSWTYEHPVSDHFVRSVREIKDFEGNLLGYVAGGETGPSPLCSVQGVSFTLSCCNTVHGHACPGIQVGASTSFGPNRAFTLLLTRNGEFTDIVYYDGRYFSGHAGCCDFQGQPERSGFLAVEPIPISGSEAVPDLIAVGFTTAAGVAATGPTSSTTTGNQAKALVVKLKMDGTPVAARAYSSGVDARFEGIAFRGNRIVLAGTTAYNQTPNTSDVLVAKLAHRGALSDFGQLDWIKTLGGSREDVGRGIARASDGVVVTGSTRSFASGANPDRKSAFLLKLDDNGNLAFTTAGDPSTAYSPPIGWSLFGGNATASGEAVSSLQDGKGGFLVAGNISREWFSALNQRPPNATENEPSRDHGLLIRTDSNGRVEVATANETPPWIQSFGHRVGLDDAVSQHEWESKFLGAAVAPDGTVVAAGYDTNCAAIPDQNEDPCMHQFVVKVADTGAPPCSCSDGLHQPGCDETGVDCGPGCRVACTSCSDCEQNGTETGRDCGGGHARSGEQCPACPNTQVNCPATCSDGQKNGSETGVDCGGANCPKCLPDGEAIFQGNTGRCFQCHGTTGCNGWAPANAGATCFACVRRQILDPKGGMPKTISDEDEIQAVFNYLTSLDTSGCTIPSAACSSDATCPPAASQAPVTCEEEIGVCFRCRGACN